MTLLHVLDLLFVTEVFAAPLEQQYTCTGSAAPDIVCQRIVDVCVLDHPDYFAVCPHTITAAGLSDGDEVCAERVAFTLVVHSFYPFVFETTEAREVCVSTAQHVVGVPF